MLVYDDFGCLLLLVVSAMWVLKNVKKSACLKELSLSDQPEKRDCFLYKLSQKPGTYQERAYRYTQ